MQDRSRTALSRILEATEWLLRERLLDEITLADILQRSRVSVGAFYARFGGKEALVPCLYDRYDQGLEEAIRRVLDPGRWSGRGLRERARTLVRYAVRMYRRNRGLMRALALHARSHPDAVSPAQHARRAAQYRDLAAFFLVCRGEIARRDAEAAVSFGLLVVGATLREKILYDTAPHPRAVAIADRELGRETAAAFLAYLSSPEAP